jgi:glutamate-1-semialdehyde 2,1-aminomutase
MVTLSQLTQSVYEHLEQLGQRLETGLRDALREAHVAGCVQRVGSMITVFFGPTVVRSWDDAAPCDTKRFGRFHQGLIKRGVYWPPAQFEAAFISNAHTEADIARTLEAARGALAD